MPLKNVLYALVCILIGSMETIPVFSQFPSGVNYIESRVLPYTLPDPLKMPNGQMVKNKNEWIKIQRPYIYHLFENNVYGRYPTQRVAIQYRLLESNSHALCGIAIRKQVRIFLKQDDTSTYVDVLVYLPNNIKKPVPVFLGYNVSGNSTVQRDPAIFLSDKPVYRSVNFSTKSSQKNDELSRGIDSSRWPVKTILANGFGVVTACNSDIEPDIADGWKTGIRTSLQDVLNIRPQEWGAIGAWAWGLSRIMDYLEKDKDIDAKRVAVIGLSRLGKTALWAGASDARFSIVISNESGEGGAALSRRWFGETVKMINDDFPYWFVPEYKKYNDNVYSLPIDQHELLTLMAPRLLYVASAAQDFEADPKGEFLSTVNAGSVYALFGKDGVSALTMPPVNYPVGNTIRYHVREGGHNITLYDWEQYIKFARRQERFK